MAESITNHAQDILQSAKLLSEDYQSRILQFFNSSEFWEVHGTVLTINWFVVAFIAILIKRKFKGGFSLFIHTLLFILCNVSTLFVNFGAAYKVYPNLNTFADWSLLKKGHIVTGAVFSMLLIMEWLGGIMSLVGGNSYYHKKLGKFVAYLGMIGAIFGMILAKEETKAGIFAIVFLVEAVILRTAKPQSYELKSKINRSIGELKSAKRD